MANIVEVNGVHEILMRQLPHWFKPVLEYIAIMRAYSVVLADCENTAKGIQDNFFIQTADSDTLAVWERLLGISAKPTDTIEFRRERILSKLDQTVPFTYWHLKKRLTELYGDEYALTINPSECTLDILVTSGRYGALDLLHDLIYNVIPAHLDVTSNQNVENYVVSSQYIATYMTMVVAKDITVSVSALAGGYTIGMALQTTKIQTI